MELNRDGDGFLINTSDWSEEVMYEMAKSDDMEMTDEIEETLLKSIPVLPHAFGGARAKSIKLATTTKASKAFKVSFI